MSSDPGLPESAVPPSPPRARSAMKRFMAPDDQLCSPERRELQDNHRAGRSSQKKSRGMSPPPRGPTPPSPPRPRSAVKQCVGPIEVRTVITVEPVGVAGRSPGGTNSHPPAPCDDELYADPCKLMNATNSDHSHGSEMAPQEVLRISQYPYRVGAEYSEPSSVSRDLELSIAESDPGSLVQACSLGPGPSSLSTRTPSENR